MRDSLQTKSDTTYALQAGQAARGPARLPFMSVQIQMQVHAPSCQCHRATVPTSAQARSRACEGQARPGVWTRTPLTLQHSHPAAGRWADRQSGQQQESTSSLSRGPSEQIGKEGVEQIPMSYCVVLNPALSWPNAPRCEGTGRRCRSLPEV